MSRNNLKKELKFIVQSEKSEFDMISKEGNQFEDWKIS